MKLEWIENTYNPNMPDARTQVIPILGQTKEEAWQQRKLWLADKIIGPPQATMHCTVVQLVQWNMVGVYRKKQPQSSL